MENGKMWFKNIKTIRRKTVKKDKEQEFSHWIWHEGNHWVNFLCQESLNGEQKGWLLDLSQKNFSKKGERMREIEREPYLEVKSCNSLFKIGELKQFMFLNKEKSRSAMVHVPRWSGIKNLEAEIALHGESPRVLRRDKEILHSGNVNKLACGM